MATEVVFPMLGVTTERGKVIQWFKAEGDAVEKGEILLEVEAEKVTTEVEAPASGILARILVSENQEVEVLTVLALITQHGEEIPDTYVTEQEIPAPTVQADSASKSDTQPPESRLEQMDLKVVPAARWLAMEMGVDLNEVSGSGPDGVIRYIDVQQAVEGHKKEESARASTLAHRKAAREGISLEGIQGSGVRGRVMKADVQKQPEEKSDSQFGGVIPMDSMRQVIARRMSESAFTAPHISFFTDICLDPLFALRQEVLQDFEQKYGLRPSINDFLIKAVSLNIREFPILNAQMGDNEIHIMPEINVCLAVALPKGLIVPALFQTDRAGLADIARQRQDLVSRTKSGKLSMEELERGTFTISSLAQFDITHFTAIINPPQSGILSVGKTREELYMDNGQVKSRSIATFGLSVDHRIIDGAVAAGFLQNLKKSLEKPYITFLCA
ncbi:MAG: dihydrolipoamide acetyltransferase family protein [Desulfovermiculus sp.]|nr:dihydrolipoamide acetyltransferase family protein [Desulfovermiculus sp.]